MNLQRCEKGHFYDSDKFKSCPHCSTSVKSESNYLNGNDDQSVTVAMSSEQVNSKVMEATVSTACLFPNQVSSVKPESVSSFSEAVKKTIVGAVDHDEDKTIRFYTNDLGVEPVVGWLVGLNGDAYGRSYCLKSGRNFIGRGEGMDVRIEKDQRISRERHAIITYDPKSRKFIAQPGESRELFYLDDEVVLNNKIISNKDILTIGGTKLMLVVCCDETFCWEDIKNTDN